MFKAIYYIAIGIIGSITFSHTYNTFGVGDVIKELANKPIAVAYADAPSNKTIDSVTGIIVAVSDGDTATVRTSYGDLIIRLFAIDAPEAKCHGFSDNVCIEDGQAKAKASKLYLRNLVLNKNVEVKLGQGTSGKRLVGTIFSDGQDVNLEMVKAGYAWHYKFFSKNQTTDDRKIYTDAENNARALKAGIWEDNNPIPPWNWRKQHKD